MCKNNRIVKRVCATIREHYLDIFRKLNVENGYNYSCFDTVRFGQSIIELATELYNSDLISLTEVNFICRYERLKAAQYNRLIVKYYHQYVEQF